MMLPYLDSLSGAQCNSQEAAKQAYAAYRISHYFRR